MQETYADLNFEVLGVTDADDVTVLDFVEEHQLNFPIQASAPLTRKAFGVAMIWGSTYYLVDPKGQIVGKGLDQAETHLDQLAANP